MEKNIVTMSDSYKMTHSSQMVSGTEHVYSYFESRHGARFDKTTFFGLQYIIKEYLEGVVVTKEKIDKAEVMMARHFGNPNIFKRERWDYIVEKHDGKLPVSIKAVPEGTRVSVGNILMSVVNTDPNCAWLTNHLETILCHIWFPSTVATLSKAVKDMFEIYLKLSSDEGENFAGKDFMLNDFGKRGTSSLASAGIGGTAHLVNFLGTDTIIALEYAQHFYNCDMAGFSVVASEHSIMTALGREGEATIIENLIKQFPSGILSVVSDSYDIYNCVENIYGKQLKDHILARDGKFVVRPDSGDPVEVTKRVFKSLGENFGYTINNRGYKILNPKVGFIWGDGIDIDGIDKILHAMINEGWSAENLVFGMGGGLLQKVNRDTQRFAFKCSAQYRDGKWHDIFKDPIDGSKTSKKGILALCHDVYKDEFKTVKVPDLDPIASDILVEVFRDGVLLNEISLDEVRKNAEK